MEPTVSIQSDNKTRSQNFHFLQFYKEQKVFWNRNLCCNMQPAYLQSWIFQIDEDG